MTGSEPSLYLSSLLLPPLSCPCFHMHVTVTVSHMPSGQVAKSFHCSLKFLSMSHSVILVTDPIITIYFLLLYLPCYHGDAGLCCECQRVCICITGRVSFGQKPSATLWWAGSESSEEKGEFILDCCTSSHCSGPIGLIRCFTSVPAHHHKLSTNLMPTHSCI